MSDLPIICDFLWVIPEDISDFPLECKVELAIDLVPGTSPVSMAPYQIPTSELSELNKQLKDLLEKKFIRLSVSAWGAPMLLVKKKDDNMRLCVNYW